MAAEAEPRLHVFTRTSPQIAALEELCHTWQTGPQRFWAFDAVLHALERPGNIGFFAADGAASASWDGVVLADVGPFTADLLYIYVIPASRRRGIARALLTRLIHALARRDGIEALLLEVRASNVQAQRLYHELDFVPVGRRKAYYSDGEDALVLKRVIGPEDFIDA